MGSYGGFRPYPRRYGGAKPKAKVFLEAMNASRGTAYDTKTATSAVYVENLGIARAIARAWETNERLSYLWDPDRMTVDILVRWEKILALPVAPTDTEPTRRDRLKALSAAIAEESISSLLTTKLQAALGAVFVAVEFIPIALANIGVPDGSYPFGTVKPGYPWHSSVAHILVRVTQPAGYRDDQFYDAVATIASLLDPLLPADMTFDWYRAPEIGAPIVVAGGPSAAGWYLDERNLDESIFDV
jgi:hypothetical protein